MKDIKLCFLIFLFVTINCTSLFSQERQLIPLMDDWFFFRGETALSNLDSIEGECVSLPHTWNAIDGLGGKDRTYYRGNGVYMKTVELSATLLREKRLYIRFEAVSTEATIYVNGQRVGSHQGAFNAFCFDITSYCKAGKNKILVEASNAWNENIAPLAGDFTVWGGIYRPVTLLLTNAVCISPTDYASSGVYVTQTCITDTCAILDVTTMLDNNTKRKQALTIKINMVDAENNLVVSSTKKVTLDKGRSTDVCQQLVVSNPVLWDGLQKPHLYTILVQVSQGGHVIDEVVETCGLRYYQIDAEKGFLLNGHSYPIRGVNRHQDRETKGWAISEDDQLEDMSLLMELGANGIRTAHYPMSAFFYHLCDQHGLLVWSEIPLIERITESTLFYDNCKLQLIEMIKQNYNHPSIICWGLFNELSKGEPAKLIVELNNLAHKEDVTRFTVCAPNHENREENNVTDQLAYNTYPGWYWADPEAMQGSLDHWKNLAGHRGICVSEYGAGSSILHHEQGIKKAPKADGQWHPEEWQAIVHEKNYAAISKRDFVWGSFVWNMFDFGVASRNEGERSGINDKGLVTYDRKVKKDAFYFYKANWSEEPVLYITSRRHIHRNQPTTDIKVYSNLDSLTMTVNGIKYAMKSRDAVVCYWEKIPLQTGNNRIYVSGTKNGRIVEDACTWVYQNKM